VDLKYPRFSTCVQFCQSRHFDLCICDFQSVYTGRTGGVRTKKPTFGNGKAVMPSKTTFFSFRITTAYLCDRLYNPIRPVCKPVCMLLGISCVECNRQLIQAPAPATAVPLIIAFGDELRYTAIHNAITNSMEQSPAAEAKSTLS
jgi:hypothetical protein